LDDTRLELALRVINHFAVYDRDTELMKIQRHLAAREPQLIEVIESAAAREGLLAH